MMQGSLCKWVNIVKGYQYRYVTLDFNQALLSYYTSKEKMLKGDRRGCVRLKGAVIGIDAEDENTFTITVDQKIFHFKAQDFEERNKWVSALEDTIFQHTYKKKLVRKSEKVPTIEEYERKLNETNLYLSILNEQIKLIDDKISNSNVEKDELQLVDIKVKTLTLIDTIKHTILLLEASKDTLKTKSNKIKSSNELLNKSSTEELTNNSSQSSIETNNNTSIKKDNYQQSRAGQELLSSTSNRKVDEDSIHNLNVIPETSYSSSDDDDSYFDAEDENSFSIHKTGSTSRLESKLSKTKIGSLNHSNSLTEIESQLQNHTHLNKLDVKDYDACYEDDNEDELGSLEGHGSVISHIISQVKIGMDLTKVVLPTFILERRSLLEMYADFFAHPDLFCSIPDFETPEQRFIATVKWYMSSFHAGRKSSVAKKPYNPILGETFECFWNLPNIKKQTKSKPVQDGPIPWALSCDLSFIAEQVSHHPAVSAFYVENVEKRIMCISQIHTKSKFLGLSIGVHNIGQGSVYLLDHGEEYICTFPSAYGRSILTVPWIELGGNVTITCAQSGYSANIDFLSKPFYGGKKNRISGEILNPNKKTILTLTGEWNGVMHAKNSAGNSEVFVNTKEMPIIRKIVKPIAEQKEFESRRLWKEVTAALKEKDVHVATSCKTEIEQRQRDLVKERAETGEKWENRAFYQDAKNGNWQHKAPLTVRQTLRE